MGFGVFLLLGLLAALLGLQVGLAKRGEWNPVAIGCVTFTVALYISVLAYAVTT